MRKLLVYLLTLLSFAIFSTCTPERKDSVKATITINTNNGHALKEGCSGFNVRIADKVWSYTHPDFREAVHGLRPGWLRYFSGTMGDAFNSGTGLYDIDYAFMFDKQEQYFKGYMYTDIKGPHRIIDLYELLGEIGGKLIVTINGFSTTPEDTKELALFCKNNNIIVEAWQFCNEPYFYVPHRERYWWNSGYDYAAKMKPHADAILEVYPEAMLSLNFTWDGIWGFMKEIYKYQEEHGAYWNVFSKHSYAPHIGGKEPYDSAYRRANSKLPQVTSKKAMRQIEKYTEEGIPLMITEFGVWNRPLNGIISAIYNAEYTLRQLQHPNAFYIGPHEVSNKYKPGKGYHKEIIAAYKEGRKLNTDSLRTGIVKDDEGKAMEIIHQVTNNSNYTWNAVIEGAAMVPGLKGKMVESSYARAFKGTNGYNYLIITNRSDKYHDYTINIDNKVLKKRAYRKYIFSETAPVKDVEVFEDKIKTAPLEVPPYSVVMIKWESDEQLPPTASRIYKANVIEEGVSLTWWPKEIANAYEIHYGTHKNTLESVVNIESSATTTTITDLKSGTKYYFGVVAKNQQGKSDLSELVSLTTKAPEQPEIYNIARRDTTITVMWRSVASASGYKVNVKAKNGSFEQVYDAKNVFGYRVSGLQFDVPYEVNVTAYNGLGNSEASEKHSVVCSPRVPLGPRNVSAFETKDGQIYIEWIHQDTANADVKYRVYRGTKLHQFEVLAENITTNHYFDKKKEGTTYFYTVKSYTSEGECNFYPNIATQLSRSRKVQIDVIEIKKLADRYEIKVSFDNIHLDGDAYMGVAYSDISFLTVEESIVKTTDHINNVFTVTIPKSALKKGSKYAIKGFVNTNGKSIYSLPPHKNIDLSGGKKTFE